MSKIIWITGASQGIGAATAKALSRQGHTVLITARHKQNLDDVARTSERIHSYPGDITVEQDMARLVAQIEDDHGPIDIAILNAGTYIPETLSHFDTKTFASQINLNIHGTVYCLAPLLERFTVRKAGHIAIVASVAGYRGLPKSLAYGTSKAGLIHLADALAVMGRAHNIKVQVISPGFIKTPLTDKNDFKMPFLMDADSAADRIVKGLASNRFEITFPRRFAYLLKLVGLLPNRLYQMLISKVA